MCRVSRRPAARLEIIGRPPRLAPLFARPLYVFAVLALVATSCEGTAPPPDGDPVAGSPNLADDSYGNPIIADVDDCSPELIYVWDTIDPTF